MTYNEDDLVRLLTRVTFEDMREIYRKCEFTGREYKLIIKNLEYRLWESEIELFTQNGWTIREFIEAGGTIY